MEKILGYLLTILIYIWNVNQGSFCSDVFTRKFQSRNFAYVLSNFTDTWANSYVACFNYNGQLATPSNPEVERDLRIFLANVDDKIWLGGRTMDGNWRWEFSREPVTHQNFFDASCAEAEQGFGLYAMYTTNGTWGWCKERDNSTLHFVCEFQISPTVGTTSTSTASTTHSPTTVPTSTTISITTASSTPSTTITISSTPPTTSTSTSPPTTSISPPSTSTNSPPALSLPWSQLPVTPQMEQQGRQRKLKD